MFLIKSNKHDKGATRDSGKAIWWRKDSSGYTSNIAEAGLYTETEVMEICDGSHGENQPFEALPLLTVKRIDLLETLYVISQRLAQIEKRKHELDATDIPPHFS